jgi:hypothetical protein
MAEPLIRGSLHLSALWTPAAVLHHPYRCSIAAAVMSLRERTRRPGLGIIEPCLPSPAKALPLPGWLRKIEHDGFRILARRDSAGVRLTTRAGNDFSSHFPFIAMAMGKLPVRSLPDRWGGDCLRPDPACRLRADPPSWRDRQRHAAQVAGDGFAASGSALDILRSSAAQGAIAKAVTGYQGLITEAG